MNAYVSPKELALLPANRISYPEHHADARAQAAARRQPGMRGWFTRWMERRAVAAELAQLSDRELADIGLTRSSVGRVYDPGFTIHR